jgi:2-oxoglutarate ferredoxin oxidoreductase subunit delta
LLKSSIEIRQYEKRDMAGKIKIDSERCKGCGLCIEACAKRSITKSGKTNKMGYFFSEPCGNGCTGCAICALICPDTAIEVCRDEPKPVAEATSAENR